MKRIKSLLFCPLLLLLTACDDFLDRQPLDVISDADYWKTESHVRTYSYGFYTRYFAGYGSGGSNGPFFLGQTLNDDIAHNVQNDFTPLRIPETDSGWTFTTVRKANYMLEQVEGMEELEEEARNHWLGISRFFRATEYANLVFTYGDVPWYDRVLATDEKDELFKDRDPRTQVVRKILEDLTFAIENTRENDGTLNLNKYVVAAVASRLLLREGTFLKYHDIDQELAIECLTAARKAALVIMNARRFFVSDSYNALFSSEDLSSNTEVIFYRKYQAGILSHSTLTYTNKEAQTGATRSLLESYLTKDGLPVYATDPEWKAITAEQFFSNRDPRLTATFRDRYFLRGEDCSPFDYSTSGFSLRKYMDDEQADHPDLKYFSTQNITDAPVVRLGEVLLNYAEATWELGLLTQDDLDISVNLLRGRRGMTLPALQVIGGEPAVNGTVYDDPKRDPDVPAMLWEIRRERRVELVLEGFRLNDLKRWKKMDYMYNGANPDIRYGAYIRYADYPKVSRSDIYIADGADEGYILCNRGNERAAPLPRNYINPVPSNQIQLYLENGYTLTQTKEWRE
ncbi:MAG: RagB/SusD family nutrient uptake outer membrane protein [Bacteroides sp.]|nr:RagB/SusD family nutrient uptake outer membrane protein [Bacteroides sp.]